MIRNNTDSDQLNIATDSDQKKTDKYSDHFGIATDSDQYNIATDSDQDDTVKDIIT